MFGWLQTKRAKKARAILTRHINNQAIQRVKGTHRNNADRTSFCKVVHIIPLARNGSWQPSNATQVVTHDISAAGLSVIHDKPVESDRVVVGIPEGEQFNFIKCRVEHCTKLSAQYFQVGLHAEELANINFRTITDFRKDLQLEQDIQTGDVDQSIASILDYWDTPGGAV